VKTGDATGFEVPPQASSRGSGEQSCDPPTDPVPASSLAAMSDLVDDSVARARLVWLDAHPARRTFADLLVAATEAHTADEE